MLVCSREGLASILCKHQLLSSLVWYMTSTWYWSWVMRHDKNYTAHREL